MVPGSTISTVKSLEVKVAKFPLSSNAATAITSSYLPSNFTTADTYNYYATVNYTGLGCNAATSAQASIIVLAEILSE